MKKIMAGLFLLMGSIAVTAQTAEEVLAKYETAAGGRDKLEGIKTLEVISNLKLGMMGQTIELPVTLVKEKGKLFRRQIGGIMGMGESFTMVTDTSGVVFIPAMRGFGRGGGDFGGGMEQPKPTITRLSAQEVKDQQYELDCAGPFGELVDYAAKGHKAELMGTEKVNKVPCFKIKMTLKSGQEVTYFIDSQTFLVRKMEAVGDMALNLTGFGSMMKAFGSNVRKDTKASIIIKENQDIGGIKFPAKYQLSFGPVESDVENTSVKVNDGLEDRWYYAK